MPSSKDTSRIGKESILVIFKAGSGVVMVVSCGKMESSLRASGGRARRMDGEYGNLSRVIIMRASGGTTGKTAEGATTTQGPLSSMATSRIF